MTIIIFDKEDDFEKARSILLRDGHFTTVDPILIETQVNLVDLAQIRVPGSAYDRLPPKEVYGKLPFDVQLYIGATANNGPRESPPTDGFPWHIFQ